jgi:hypothetical protein
MDPGLPDKRAKDRIFTKPSGAMHWIHEIQLFIIVTVTGAEKEVIGASFCAKMTSGEEVTAIFTYFVEANRTFKHPSLLF